MLKNMRLRALQILMVSGLAICCRWGEYCNEEEIKCKEVYHSGIIKQKAKSINNDNLKNFMNEISVHLSHSVYKTDNNPDISYNDTTPRLFNWFEKSSFEKRDGKWELIYSQNKEDE